MADIDYGEFIMYAKDRGVVVDYPEASVALFKAWDYLSGLCWKGEPVDPDQTDIFPRIINGVTVDTPRKVFIASWRLAMASLDGVDLEPVTGGGAQVIEERVEGAITMKYAESTIGSAAMFPWLDGLVNTWVDDACGPDSLACNVKVRRG